MKRLQHYSRAFTEYAGYSVPELIAIALASRFDFQEHEQEFTEKVHRWGRRILSGVRSACSRACVAGSRTSGTTRFQTMSLLKDLRLLQMTLFPQPPRCRPEGAQAVA